MKHFILTTICLLAAIFVGCVAGGGGSSAPADNTTPTDTLVGDLASVDSVEPADASPGTEVLVPEDAWTQSNDVAGSKQVLPAGLKGVAPPGDTALPQFSSVVDQDGKSVGPDRLVGTWSVLWFYPIASTAG